MSYLGMLRKKRVGPMCRPTRLHSIVAFAWAALVSPVCMGQTPVPAPSPSISLPWLAAVSVDRARARGGETVRCTVSLLRPAVKPIVVGVTVGKTVTTFPINPERPYSSIKPSISRLVTDVPATLTVPAGSSSVTFEIRTSSAAGPYGLPPAQACPAKYRVTVVYGGEQRVVDFDVSNEPCV